MSSETGPSLDKAPTKDPLHVEGAPEALQIEMIDKLRAEEMAIEMRLVNNPAIIFDYDAQERARQEARNQFERLIEEHLAEYGIIKGDEDDEKYKQYVKLLRDSSIDRVPENIWKDGKRDDEGVLIEPPKRNAVYNEVKEKYTDKTDEDSKRDEKKLKEEEEERARLEAEEKARLEREETEAKEREEKEKAEKEAAEKLRTLEEELKIKRDNVDLLRNRLAELSARRQGRLWKSKTLEESYAAIEQSYRIALSQLIRDELEAEKVGGKERTNDEERAEAALRLITNFSQLQEKSAEELKGTKVGVFIEWLNRGGKATRFIKGVGLGAIVGLSGAALTAVTAGTFGGAIAAGAATAATLATRFARGFATFDARDGRGMETVTPDEAFRQETLEASGAKEKSTGEAINLIHDHLMKLFEKATQEEVGKRRKSTLKAMGAVVVGSAAAEGVYMLLDNYYDMEKANDWLVGEDNANASPAPEASDTTPALPPVIETPPPTPTYTAEALNIQTSEGWYQTFKDMGIPQKDWAGLLNNVGPELHGIQVDGHPLAYQMPNGEWGIRMTPDGTMPQEALDAISRAHSTMTGVPVAPVEVVAPVAAEVPVPDNIEELTAPVNHDDIQHIIHKEVIFPSEVAKTAALEQLTYVASWMSPENIGERLGLSAVEWERLEDYIVTHIAEPLYRNVFEVTPSGYLRFVTDKIPDNTFADMLSNIPVYARATL